jgi:transcription elongation factor Elf1
MIKDKIKMVVAEILEDSIYFAQSECPYCETANETEVEEDNIIIIQNCYSCQKKYKVKIPKDSIY